MPQLHVMVASAVCHSSADAGQDDVVCETLPDMRHMRLLILSPLQDRMGIVTVQGLADV